MASALNITSTHDGLQDNGYVTDSDCCGFSSNFFLESFSRITFPAETVKIPNKRLLSLCFVMTSSVQGHASLGNLWNVSRLKWLKMYGKFCRCHIFVRLSSSEVGTNFERKWKALREKTSWTKLPKSRGEAPTGTLGGPCYRARTPHYPRLFLWHSTWNNHMRFLLKYPQFLGCTRSWRMPTNTTNACWTRTRGN